MGRGFDQVRSTGLFFGYLISGLVVKDHALPTRAAGGTSYFRDWLGSSLFVTASEWYNEILESMSDNGP